MVSLAQQLAELDSAAPQEFDTEDNVDRNELLDGARDHYIDVGPSALRKLADNELDPKYDAVAVSRKQLDESQSEDENDEEVPSDDAEGNTMPVDAASEPEASQDDLEDDEDEDEGGEPAAEDTTSALLKTRQADVEKGKAVTRQLQIWDSLIDTRIRLQKSVAATQKLPRGGDLLHETLASAEGQEAVAKFFEAANALSESLFDMQERLFALSTDSAPPPRKKRKTDDQDVRSAAHGLAALNAAHHPHLVQTLNKWSAKVQAVSPALFANANAFSRRQAGSGSRGVVELIDDALAKREPDADGYDDTEFYQALLRDVIEARGGAGGMEPWMLQKQRKVKKVVDTKASKGRKLRYTVHEKLKHFMVPVPNTLWHEEQVDELFASLLGKGVEHRSGKTAAEMNGDNVRVEDGFRLFG